MTLAADQRRLGREGPVVSRFGLGALSFATESDTATAHDVLDRYVDRGGVHIDVADVYGQGTSERVVGAWLARRRRRDGIVLASKIGQAMSPDPADRGLHPTRVPLAVRASLTRLGTDHLDLLYLHCWDPTVPLDDTLGAVQVLVDKGLVRAIGVSNYLGSQLQRATLLQAGAHRAPISVLQAQYSLLVRQIEWELTDLCRGEQVGLVVWSPLCGGWLAGAFSRDAPPVDHPRDRSIFAYADRATPRTWSIVEAVRDIAADHGATMAQVALRWLLEQPLVDSVLLGPATVAQLEENLAAGDIELTPADRDQLNEVSAVPEPEYPFGFARMLARQFDD
jgi:aryl-alcohol dehydrogenase-like predicted oxidoreductase